MTTVTGTSNSSSTPTKTSSAADNAQATSDRFLKLLVAQMQNQDPLNPMDNAQVTTQMAQINTVQGIGTLNQSMQTLSGQFVQMQALQGASLVGRDVLVEGNKIRLDAGKADAGYDLSGPADSVRVDVYNGAGKVVDSIDMGAESSGQHSFTWTAPADLASTSGLTFKVVATKGTTAVTSTALTTDRISAVQTGSSGINLELAGGKTVAYADVKAFN